MLRDYAMRGIFLATCFWLVPCVALSSTWVDTGLSITYRPNEYTPAVEAIVQSDHMRFEVPIGATVLANDPYNSEKLNVSYSGLLTFATMALLSLFHSEDVGEKASNVVAWVMAGTAGITNARFYPFRFSAVGDSTRTILQFSPFIQTRTELYGAVDSTSWGRYSPGFGIELLRLGPPRASDQSRRGWAVRVGAECPYDFITMERSGWTEWKFSIGILRTRLTPLPKPTRAQGETQPPRG